MMDPFTGMVELQKASVLGTEWKGRANQHSTVAVQPPISIEDVTTVHINELELKDGHGKPATIFPRIPSDHNAYAHLNGPEVAVASGKDFDAVLDLILSESVAHLG